MKHKLPGWFVPNYLTLSLTVLILAAVGCATSGYKQADKTGESINSLRNDVVEMKAAVDGSMKALDGLIAAASTDPRKPYETFAKSVQRVEDASATARKQAQAMQESGQAYFAKWESELATVKNEEIRTLAQQRRAKLQETFNGIKTAAEGAKEKFPPFLNDLKDLRTALSADLTAQSIDGVRGTVKKTKTAGVEVQNELDTLVAELNSVVASITASTAKK